MKVNKGDKLTFRFQVEDPEEAEALLSALRDTMQSEVPYCGLLATAVSRGDVFAERNEAREELSDFHCETCDCDLVEFDGNE